MTAVSNVALTAAQWNASVRDNLLMTAPALATTAGQIFAATGANTIVARFPTWSTIGTSQTTASTTYTDLTTVGPSITSTVGARALLIYGAEMSNNTSGMWAIAAPQAGAGSTITTASDGQAIQFKTAAVDQGVSCCQTLFLDAMTPGSYTFTLKYRVTGGTGAFTDRRIQIVPF